MPHPAETRTDQRLARLLETEQRLEADVRAAELTAAARVATARATASAGDGARDAELEAAAREDEQRDRAHHAEELRGIAAGAAERVARIAAVSEDTIDRLARRALAEVAGVTEPP